MPLFYSVDEAKEDGAGYFRTKAEAFTAARDISKTGDGDVIEVKACHVHKLDVETFLRALNQRGWADSVESVAMAKNGRIVSERT